MRTTHVVVLPYDPKWNEDFSAIRAELETAMGGAGSAHRTCGEHLRGRNVGKALH